jgi:protein-L-isoaspartate(D-aspartate) O-methyltransferase
MDSNEELIDYLKKEGWIKSRRVEAAFKKIDRALFVPASQKSAAYADYPLPVMKGQTISAPSIVAIMTEELRVEKGMRVLEVGTGSGYQACVLAELVGKKGKVFTTEIYAELMDYAMQKAKQLHLNNIDFFHRDGSKGLQEKAPFDRIIVTAAAPNIPAPLFNQLKEGGRMVLPAGSTYFQDLLLVEKIRGQMAARELLPVIFVPLVGEHGFN